VAPIAPFPTAVFSDRFKESYSRLSAEKQRDCDQAVLSVIKGLESPGLRIKPIQPDKHYLEARIGSGDRVVFRRAVGQLLIIDVVTHDEIGRYGRRPKG
jgi:hypothetical protein